MNVFVLAKLLITHHSILFIISKRQLHTRTPFTRLLFGYLFLAILLLLSFSNESSFRRGLLVLFLLFLWLCQLLLDFYCQLFVNLSDPLFQN